LKTKKILQGERILKKNNFIAQAGLFFLLALLLFSCAQKAKETNTEVVKYAYHEAGHALMVGLNPLLLDLKKVTIVQEGDFGGFTEYDCEETLYYFAYLLKIDLAGYLAEEITFGYTNETILDVFCNCYGSDSSDFILAAYRCVKKDPALKVTAQTQITKDDGEKMHKLMLSSVLEVRKALKEHKKQLQAIAEALLEKKTLSGEEVYAIMKKTK